MLKPAHQWARRAVGLLASRTINMEARQTAEFASANNMTAQTTNYSDSPLGVYTHGLTGVAQDENTVIYNILVILFMALLGATLFIRISRMGLAQIRQVSTMSHDSHQAYWAKNGNPYWPRIKKHLLFSPLFGEQCKWLGGRHNREFQLSAALGMGTIPSRFHTLLLISYLASNVAFCLVLPWGREQSQSVVAALRGRSGSLAALNLIPTILFAMRNNPLIPILRVSYDTFNLLHRWCARMVIILAALHTICWMANTDDAYSWHGFSEALSKVPSYQWGMVGTISFVFIGLQTLGPIRHAFYETFLNIHKVAVILALVGLYEHLKLHGLPQLPWVHYIIAMLAIEYFLRISFVFYYNFSAKGMTRITMTALPGEATRVTFQLVRPWTTKPGCHAHVFIPTISSHTSHPFSVAWVDRESNLPAIYHENDKLPSNNAEIDLDNMGKVTTYVNFVCRVRTGFTRHIYDKATAAGGTYNTWGWIEGPYGGHESLDSYGTVVLFAGGVGITHQISYIKHLIEGYATGTTSTRKVVLAWSVPTTDCLEWVRDWMDTILQLKGRKEVLKIILFITKPRSHTEVQPSPSGTVQIVPGRPSVGKVIDDEIKEREGAMAITVCGPGSFSDAVRNAARKRVTVGVIDFIEEAFTY